VVDGFGSIKAMGKVRALFAGGAVQLEVFRPLDRWYAWLQPGQLRRLHQKLCVCDTRVAFVGGINIIDDRNDLSHGWSDTPRLDFAVRVEGALAESVLATARAMWARAHLASGWREEVRVLARSAEPVREALGLLRQLRVRRQGGGADSRQPVRAAFLVRDNLRQRRAIERSYIDAIRGARQQLDIAVPYFYPGHGGNAVVDLALQQQPHARSTTRCEAPASASTNTRPPSCTPRWRWWTVTGPPWAAATSTR